MASHREGSEGETCCIGVSDGKLRVQPVITLNITVINFCSVSQVLRLSLDERLMGCKVSLKSRMFKKNKQIDLYV